MPLPRDASKLPASLGAPYAVCPVCRTRGALKGRPAKLACPKCQGVFGVAKEEGYLKKGGGATAD